MTHFDNGCWRISRFVITRPPPSGFTCMSSPSSLGTSPNHLISSMQKEGAEVVVAAFPQKAPSSGTTTTRCRAVVAAARALEERS